MTNKPDLLEGFLMRESTPAQDYQPPVVQTPVNENYKDSSMEVLLKDLQDGKIMTMKEVIEDIEILIEERKSLQNELFSDVNGILMNINNFLTAAGEKIDTIEQLKFQQKLIEIEEFKMQEKVNSFRDIASLKKELRDRMQEYKDKQNNVDVIDQLLR